MSKSFFQPESPVVDVKVPAEHLLHGGGVLVLELVEEEPPQDGSLAHLDDGDDDDDDDGDDDLYIIGAVCMYVCMYVSKSHYFCIQRIYFSGWEFFFFFEFFC